MPSRFEPCGLNQMYSLRYETVPIVHSTGGLADTVVNVTTTTLADGSATGFVFDMERAIDFLSPTGCDLANAGHHRHAAGFQLEGQREALHSAVLGCRTNSQQSKTGFLLNPLKT